MSSFPLDIVVAAGLLLLNRVVPRGKLAVLPLYLALQATNVLAAGWFIWRGVIGLEHLPVVGWMVAGPFLLHLVMNASQRSRALHDAERG